MSYIKRAIEELQERGISNPTNDDLKMLSKERKAEQIEKILIIFLADYIKEDKNINNVVDKIKFVVEEILKVKA